MESTIAQLLDRFEQGKMNRRQLIHSLAYAAVGTQALRATPLAGEEATPASANFRTAGLDHVSYAVSDYGRSRDFYADLMGWEVANDNGESQAELNIGGGGTMIVRNSREPYRVERDGRPPLTGVVNHIAWRIEDFDTDAVRSDLEARGLNPRRDQGGGDGYDSYHVLDPDGWDLQISG